MIHVFDTSVLKWAYIPGNHHHRCRQILTRLRGHVYIAEISLLELVSALGAEVRGRRMSLRQYQAADRAFFRDVAEGSITVRGLPSSEYLSCRYLLALVGIDSGRNLRAQDGIIAYMARQIAIEQRARVKLLTSDKKLASVINDLSVFGRLVKCEYLDPN